MNFHVEMTLKAKTCQECKKYLKTKQESLIHLPKKHFIKLYMSCLWQQFQDEMLHTKKSAKKAPGIFLNQFQDIHSYILSCRKVLYLHTYYIKKKQNRYT